ncbi:cytochrome c family protein [Microvirga sp. W0021]|uniref:Cytochrome c family protein n=1 Tax=Hohaiivirga grylli TaxID=3133970 RepID=A0ABV0BKY7_9HYPH
MYKLISVIALSLLGMGAAHAQEAGDPAAGEKVFIQCRACHQIGPKAKNMTGPLMNGLFGRQSGSIPGFNYSEANKNSGIVWDEEVFREYIKDPRKKIPKTKMIFVGVKDEKKISDLIAYMKQFDQDGNKK